ncbi:Neuropeptide receptor A5 [Operophtera brumata]|uniref:Neuropeptide receptor A5 n=1 Tax=Operophtera brumata TaxID=104452 RepID=A0A0L7KSA2_OPEBR|nr:Neuropeptide receptor A5 [Operophtera brumata]
MYYFILRVSSQEKDNSFNPHERIYRGSASFSAEGSQDASCCSRHVCCLLLPSTSAVCAEVSSPYGRGLAANRRTTPSIHTNASTEGQLRSRRKAAKMLVAVIAMFAVCYFPVHLLSVLRGSASLSAEGSQDASCCSRYVCYLLLPSAFTVCAEVSYLVYGPGLVANRRTTPSIYTNASIECHIRSRRKAANIGRCGSHVCWLLFPNASTVYAEVSYLVCGPRLASKRRTTPSIHTNASIECQCFFSYRVAIDVQQSDVMTCIALISHVMCYANSAVNPLIYNFMSGKFRREFHRSYFKCLCCCHTPTPEQNGASFAPIGSTRGTTRTVVRRNDSCASYRLTHLSPSNHNIHRDYVRNTNTSFIENVNGNRRPKVRDDSISESATRFTLATDVCRD